MTRDPEGTEALQAADAKTKGANMTDQSTLGCVCHGCSKEYHDDLIVSDEVWAKIAPKPVDGFKGGGLLCPSCIWSAVAKLAIGAFFEAAPKSLQPEFFAKQKQVLAALDRAASVLPDPVAVKGLEEAERLRKNLADYDADVAAELSTGGERADLWTEIDVSVEDLRAVLAATDRSEAGMEGAVEETTGKAGDQGDDAVDAMDMLNWFRLNGWSVAIHNDFRQHGRMNTFWLLTHSNGRWVKGEGVSDALALAVAMDAASAAPFLRVPEGWRTMDSAPKDQQIILYLTARGKLGECHWNPAEFDYEESLWWDVANDDECCPKWWMPRSALPAAPQPDQGDGL